MVWLQFEDAALRRSTGGKVENGLFCCVISLLARSAVKVIFNRRVLILHLRAWCPYKRSARQWQLCTPSQTTGNAKQTAKKALEMLKALELRCRRLVHGETMNTLSQNSTHGFPTLPQVMTKTTPTKSYPQNHAC